MNKSKKEIAIATAYMVGLMGGGGNAYGYWDGFSFKTYPKWNYKRFGKKPRKPNRKRH